MNLKTLCIFVSLILVVCTSKSIKEPKRHIRGIKGSAHKKSKGSTNPPVTNVPKKSKDSTNAPGTNFPKKSKGGIDAPSAAAITPVPYAAISSLPYAAISSLPSVAISSTPSSKG
eukprot:15360915-Ditylum_brightwellii.AAC.1